MRINENGNALKRAAYSSPGQRPGFKSKEENRPRDFISKRKWVVSDEKKASHFSKRMFYNTVRKKLFPLFNKFSRTIFILNPLPRATFRFVPPQLCPGLKSIGLSGRKNTSRDLCIKGSFVKRGGSTSNYFSTEYKVVRTIGKK